MADINTHTYKQPVERLNIKLSGVHVQIKMHMVKVQQQQQRAH